MQRIPYKGLVKLVISQITYISGNTSITSTTLPNQIHLNKASMDVSSMDPESAGTDLALASLNHLLLSKEVMKLD